jgi:uncharacterized protein YPO0396
MRDIRSDLQERVNEMGERIKLANDYCEKMIKQFQKERDAKVSELNARIAMMSKLLEFEQKDMGDAPAAVRPASPKLSLAG